jgi:signal transduction histidine kinase
MNAFENWGDVLLTSLQNLWISFVGFLPEIFGAFVILLIGLTLAGAFGRLAKKLVRYSRIDKLMDKMGVSKEFESMGITFSLSALVGWTVKWFLLIAVLISVLDILHIEQVTWFLQDIALYLPNVVAAIIILAIGFVAGNFVHDVVEKGVQASRIPSKAAKTLARIAKWAIIVFALMASLVQLGVAANLIQILFTGLVAMVALAGGLAFGLGGRDSAKKWLEKMDKEMEERS